MNYFFILGNHPALSIAELFSRLSIKRHARVSQEVFLADIETAFDPTELMRTLGGTIKIGRIEKMIAPDQALSAGLEILERVPKEGKFNFGISVYGKSRMDTKKLGIEMKIALRQTHGSCRFVTSREKTLSSVVVEQNRLVGSGRELVYIAGEGEMLVGVTEAVQPFKALSRRDYGRPARDDRSGMLPPKLAQIMINLARGEKDAPLLDPFCGSGTILTEALLMGYEKIIGTDISAKAIADSRDNLAWTEKQAGRAVETRLEVIDARSISSRISKNTIGAIAAETYLGPQRGKIDAQKVARELSALYTAVLRELYALLRPGARAVIAVPVFIEGRRRSAIPLSFGSFKLAAILPREMRGLPGLTERGTLLYGREGQRVWREILVLEKDK